MILNALDKGLFIPRDKQSLLENRGQRCFQSINQLLLKHFLLLQRIWVKVLAPTLGDLSCPSLQIQGSLRPLASKGISCI